MAVALTLAAAACVPRVRPVASPSDSSPEADLLGAWAGWAGSLPPVSGLRVGSLSALAYDPSARRWVAGPDEITNQRLVWFDIALGPRLVVRPRAITRLATGRGVPAEALTALDIEGLVRFPDGSFAISHEGHIDRQGVARQPRLFTVDATGAITAVVTPRARFAIDPADRSHGVRHNLGFEGLTSTPDGRLVAATEQPLAQDGPLTSATEGGVVRFAEFVRASGTWTTGREWAYRLDATPPAPGYDRPCEDGQNGLSGLTALTATTFLVIERACLLGAPGTIAFNPVRIYQVSLDGADDVSAFDSLAGRTPALATKRLVVDLMDWIPRLPAELQTLANFEGIALGPRDRQGRPTVMIVSDDNFRQTQTTAFVWFALTR